MARLKKYIGITLVTLISCVLAAGIVAPYFFVLSLFHLPFWSDFVRVAVLVIFILSCPVNFLLLLYRLKPRKNVLDIKYSAPTCRDVVASGVGHGFLVYLGSLGLFSTFLSIGLLLKGEIPEFFLVYPVIFLSGCTFVLFFVWPSIVAGGVSAVFLLSRLNRVQGA